MASAYTLITDDNDYCHGGVTFMPKGNGTVQVNYWTIYHGDRETGPTSTSQGYTMPVAEARGLWRELQAEGAQRE